MILDMVVIPEWWWLVSSLPFLVGISFGQSESEQKSSSQSTGSSRSQSESSSVGGSTGRSLAANASQSGIGFRLRPQIEDVTGSFVTRLMNNPLIDSIFSTATRPVPALDANGLYPEQKSMFAELVKQAVAPISAGMASRGMVSPENTAALGGSVATQLGPQLAELVQKNIADSVLLPGQALTSSLSPFANLLASLQGILGGTATGTSTSATDSVFKSLSQALSEASQQSTAEGKASASAWDFGFKPTITTAGGGGAG